MARIQKTSLFLAILILTIVLTACSDELGNRYVNFAECLTQKDVKMYGAYWCPHCTNQKKMFGKESFKKVNYIECDPRGEGGNPKLCLEKKIKGYPTWEFSDGSRVEGEMKLSKLAEKSGCTLPIESLEP